MSVATSCLGLGLLVGGVSLWVRGMPCGVSRHDDGAVIIQSNPIQINPQKREKRKQKPTG